MAMMAGAPPADENKGELSVCMPNGFPEDVEPPPQSVADIERSQYKTAWRRTDLVHWLCFQAQLGIRHVKDNAEAFVESMLNRFGANSSSDLPATPGVELGPREDGEPKGYWPYREAVGSLMWLSTMTRADVSNAVRGEARPSHNLADRHWKAVLTIMA